MQTTLTPTAFLINPFQTLSTNRRRTCTFMHYLCNSWTRGNDAEIPVPLISTDKSQMQLQYVSLSMTECK